MSEDLIRRSDAIKVVRHSSMEFIDADTRQKLIEAIPSIEPKCGEWANEHEDGHGSWVGTCNQCNKENRVDNFCPNCGADMRGAE